MVCCDRSCWISPVRNDRLPQFRIKATKYKTGTRAHLASICSHSLRIQFPCQLGRGSRRKIYVRSRHWLSSNFNAFGMVNFCQNFIAWSTPPKGLPSSCSWRTNDVSYYLASICFIFRPIRWGVEIKTIKLDSKMLKIDFPQCLTFLLSAALLFCC